MTDEKTYFPWRDGLPTGPEVAEIQKRWDALKPGDRIEYDEIAELIGTPYPSARFTTVTNAWRKRELENGRVIECIAGEAFVVATSDEITGKTYGTLQHIYRTAKKQRRNLGTIVAKDELEKSRVQHNARLCIAIEQDAAKMKKRVNILPVTDTKPAPRIEPPRDGQPDQKEQKK